jgi:hypothetical protein
MTRRHGIIQVNINTPAGLGNTAAEQIAETISDIYTGQVLSGLRDSITFQPSGLVHTGTRDGFAVSLLSVPFQADSWEMGIYAHSNFGSRASFTGAQDGDNATFTVNNLAEGVALQVFIDGVYQSPIFYTRLDNQVTLTFVPQPADNLQFFVNVPLNLQRAAFTGAQDGDNTVFNVPSIQDPDNMQVFFNGILLNGLQYSVVDKQVTLLFAPTSNDSLEFFTW